MNQETINSLFVNLPAILVAVGVLVASLVGTILTIFTFRRAGRAEAQSTANALTLKGVAVKVDGMSSNLVEATAGKNLAEGQLAERDAERAYQNATPHVPNGVSDEPLKVAIVENPVPVVIKDK